MPIPEPARRPEPDALAAETEPAPPPAPSPGAPRPAPPAGWRGWARAAVLVAVAGVTIYGVRELARGDWSAVVAFWRAHLPLLPLIAGLAALDVLLEGIAWTWIVERFGIRVRDLTGAKIYLAANAGKLLPAQLGRLIRPEELARLGRGTLAQCLKAEATVFVLDTISVGALLAALLAWRVHPGLAPVAYAASVGAALVLGGRVSELLAGTRLDLPRGFWLRWQTATAVAIQTAGWVAHGVAFWFLVSGLPGSTGWWEALFQAPASAVLGVGSGMPGGLGATEGLLGVSLKLNGVPGEHLAVAVVGFRILTFWVWVLVGWIALLGIRRAAARRAEPR